MTTSTSTFTSTPRELSPEDLGNLFTQPPEQISDDDFAAIIHAFRTQRTEHLAARATGKRASGKKLSKPRTSKATQNLKDLGLL